jgi:DNA (cytosine-5)-methyltransferase 1
MFKETGLATFAKETDGHSAQPTKTFSVVSMFSGCGGLDLGFLGGFTYRGSYVKRLPFRIVKAYDFNVSCAETYIYNIGSDFVVADLSSFDVKAIPAADVLIGGFPCQDFSICGPRKGVTGERGKLYEAMTRYARACQPQIVVAENVDYFARINEGRDLQKVLSAFRRSGYRMSVWSLNGPHYGLPQARKRVFLIGVRRDIEGSINEPTPRFESKPRSIEWAIADLENVIDESVPNQSEYFKANLAKAGHGQGDEMSVAHEPSYTIRANARSRIQFHYKLPRRLTIRECARIQTFPDSFLFPHPPTNTIKQIGNAVPPLLAHKVANQIALFLRDTTERKAALWRGVNGKASNC